MRHAAALFAERGFAAVSTSGLGEAVGMTGPALYKHFLSKEALLAELLEDASSRLLAGCQRILVEPATPSDTLRALIDFHIEFAISEPDIIRIQDRELAHLPHEANHRVRSLQRQYVQEWDRVLTVLRPDLDEDERQTRLLATFGLLNSSPHSAPPSGDRAPAILAELSLSALLDTKPTPVRPG